MIGNQQDPWGYKDSNVGNKTVDEMISLHEQKEKDGDNKYILVDSEADVQFNTNGKYLNYGTKRYRMYLVEDSGQFIQNKDEIFKEIKNIYENNYSSGIFSPSGDKLINTMYQELNSKYGNVFKIYAIRSKNQNFIVSCKSFKVVYYIQPKGHYYVLAIN